MFKCKSILFLSAFSMACATSTFHASAMVVEEEVTTDRTHVSKNHRPRGDKAAQALILHCVGLPDDWVLKNYVLPTDEGGLGVSAHYYVPGDGRIFQLVDESRSAFHAGVSEWRGLAAKNGLKGLNDISVGIEFQTLGYAQLPKEGYYPYHFTPFTEEQINPGILLSQQIMERHGIAPENVVWHSDVTPRKTDPGPLFPVEAFAKAGVGVWPSSDRFEDALLDTSISAVQAQLRDWGYPIVTPTGVWDEATKFALQAHYMHYLPTVVKWGDHEEKTTGSVFDAIPEWSEFPYDKDTLSISLTNLIKGNYRYE
ncbi:MAG: N-acetylmuramoyl-L-alanine amidase [Proteobacteria bacterium]|nr:N-acetylmuramoyl-L-alanine amidase [Pseudomonadota bacterium]